ncbi:hypothetical protein Leryth_011019 [Lithospermum erythrorhizon]|nr:hypothetical protein Leryth_011019 [Lithospermum erythrorhizon]
MVAAYSSGPLLNYYYYSPKFVSISCNNSLPPSNCSTSSTISDNSWNWISFLGVQNILKSESLKAHAMNATQGNVVSPRSSIRLNEEPDHLLVLVHGIMGSPSDWTYFETQLKGQLGRNFLIYVSSCNTYTKTFTGIDGAGERLAEEVMQVVKQTESLKRISFLAHSLGGLFARYAAAVLFRPDILADQCDDVADSTCVNSRASKHSSKGLIAGLEPIDFITLATPHLGVRGKKQLIISFVSASLSFGTQFLGETCCTYCSRFCWPHRQSAVPH